MPQISRGQRNIEWIQQFCVEPAGEFRGASVRLTPAQCETIRRIYDSPDGPRNAPVTNEMSAYLALLHLCGYEALQRDFKPDVHPDTFTLWNATSEALRDLLRREGEAVVCPELGTRWPRAA
jgi:hypothetical protein